MLLFAEGVPDLTHYGPLGALVIAGGAFLAYIKSRDERDLKGREESEKRYADVTNKVENFMRELSTKFDATIRETRAETKDLVDGQMTLTEKSVEAIVGFRGGLEKVEGIVRELKGEFEQFKRQHGSGGSTQ